MLSERETKSSIIRGHMASGDWRKAIAAAARLPVLGKHREAILDAHGAYVRPEWARQIGKDPEALIEGGKSALREKFLK